MELTVTSKPNETPEQHMTHSGLFYAGRCEACSKLKSGENSAILRLEPVNGQVNDFVPVDSRTGKPWPEVVVNA